MKLYRIICENKDCNSNTVLKGGDEDILNSVKKHASHGIILTTEMHLNGKDKGLIENNIYQLNTQ